MKTFKSKVLGTGRYLPKRIMTNNDLATMVETNHEWIVERTGIHERRICSTEGGEWPTDMAYHATLEALKMAGLTVNDIDCILFGSVTPDMALPNSACLLQVKLGMTNNCAALDIAAACSGFVYGFNMADSFIKTGLFKNILIVGSEMLSRRVDWEDRKTCILFGDGCGVAILGRSEEGPSDVLSTVLTADGTGQDFFKQVPGGAIKPITHEILEKREHFMLMQGQEMFKVAVRTLADNGLKAIEKAGITKEDINWVVPHQANIRILETTQKRLDIPMEKFIINIDKYGNTSAATVPIAFDEAVKDGRIKRGDLVLFDAFGAGLTAGATVIRF
jgi:3-oxoacyl-[acyl-carrier-protein] synthase-3